jgi:hypothetical protein
MYKGEWARSQQKMGEADFTYIVIVDRILILQLGYIAGNFYVEVVSGWRYMYATSTCYV